MEIPLGAFPLAGGGQGGDTADAGVQALGDAFDDAPLAGGIAAFKQHDDFQFFSDHPVLQLDQFALQTEQLFEIQVPVQGLRARHVGVIG